MRKPAPVPEPPERQALPVNKFLVLKMGTGFTTMDTTYGTRAAFGVHAYEVDGDSAEYLGHLNVFWDAVVQQLQAALTDRDTLMPCYVVQNERRYELRGVPEEYQARGMAAVEALERASDTQTQPEGEPFPQAPPPDDAPPF